MSPIGEKHRDEERETFEEQEFADTQKTTGDQSLALLALLLAMLVGIIIGFILTGNPTTDAPPPEGKKKKKAKRK